MSGLRDQVLTIRAAKSSFEDATAAKRWVRDHEWSAANMSESADWYVFGQKPGRTARTVLVEREPRVEADIEGARVTAGRVQVSENDAARRFRIRRQIDEATAATIKANRWEPDSMRARWLREDMERLKEQLAPATLEEVFAEPGSLGDWFA